uniref:Uncharacterized protein n=2 Tax=Kalanchoe fedtschenkoi TaxID=63787 RepID=A0A7N0ZYI0_KALFE
MAFSWKLLLGVSAVLVLLTLPANGQNETYLFHRCSGANYTRNSTYRANLYTLLSVVSSNRNISYGFYNFSEGQGSDRVNSIALCRGDIQQKACEKCVGFSTSDLPQRCPTQSQASIWYESCMLRYSNQMIFHSMEEPDIMSRSDRTVSDVDSLIQALNVLFPVLRDHAASGDYRRKFAVGETNFTGSDKIYGLAQCTPDLNRDQCYNCLELAFSRMTRSFTVNQQIDRYFGVSCAFRYSFDQFYNPAFVLPPVLAPNPPHYFPPYPEGRRSSQTPGEWLKSRLKIIIIIVASTACFVTLILCICIFQRRRILKQNQQGFKKDVAGIKNIESLRFNFRTIRAATNKFSDENKLGRGGFGTVYKGKLPDGQEVAIKRLGDNSGQGETEFKNEVFLLAKLQHVNLVRLLGFCLHGHERLLVYEFMPNASLDHFLFDPARRACLDWNTRHRIIGGIARGLLYLHEDSRLRIIHRDLKAGNILLDENLTPKVADFGMARLFEDQTRGVTSQIVGTYGYMAPEYVQHHELSVKLDVYSFGVLLLEVVSGQRNSCFRVGDAEEDLTSFAWLSWGAGTELEIVDPAISDGPRNEISRCIHIALLCVQENPEARPSMATVVLMLRSHLIRLPLPSQPAYFADSQIQSEGRMFEGNSSKTDISSSSDAKGAAVSVNEASITELYPR